MGKLEVNPIHLIGRLNHPDYVHIDWFSKDQITRLEALQNIPRYGAIEQMTHRPTDFAHSMKVPFFGFYMSQICMELGLPLDQPRIVYMGQHHDDAEIITGDIPSTVKRSANKSKRRRMEKEERIAVDKVEHLVAEPPWMTSYADLFDEYKKQATVEARIVNYFDKWDGLHEAVNEVVCGDNKEGFAGVIEAYRPTFEKLNAENQDWQTIINEFFQFSFFEFPDPAKLKPKTFGDMNLSNAPSLFTSLSEGNPESYTWWLSMNTAIFGFCFFDYVLPGWKDKLQPEVVEELERAKTLSIWQHMRDTIPQARQTPTFDITQGGLIVPFETSATPETLGETLVYSSKALMMTIADRAEDVRWVSGRTMAPGKYYRVNG